MKDYLILIDLQNDYFPGGNMELIDMGKAVANARLLLEEFRKATLPIIHVQHISTRPDATFFLPGTDGAAINAMVAPQESEAVVVKNYPNSFRGRGYWKFKKIGNQQPRHLRRHEPHVHRSDHQGRVRS